MLANWARFAQLLCGPWRVRLVEVRGVANGSGTPLRAQYAGGAASLAFLQPLLFATFETRVLEERVSQLGVTRALSRASALDPDLLLIERPPFWSIVPGDRADISLSAWLEQVIDLGPRIPGKPFTPLPRLMEREVARHVRKSHYAVDFTTDREDLLKFFHRLYRPYLASRFGEQAILVDEATFMRRASRQVLARLHQDRDWVAGMLLTRHRSSLRFGWFGAVSDPPPRGASETLDALVIRHAAAQGVRRIVLGHSRPSLIDGVVRYKRRFGAQLEMPRFPQQALAIVVRRWSDAVARCLNHASLVRVARNGAVLLHRIDTGTGLTVQTVPIDRAND